MSRSSLKSITNIIRAKSTKTVDKLVYKTNWIKISSILTISTSAMISMTSSHAIRSRLSRTSIHCCFDWLCRSLYLMLTKSSQMLESLKEKILSQIEDRTWLSLVHTNYSNRVVDCCWLDKCFNCKLLNISTHCFFWLSMILSLVTHEYLSSRAIHNKVLFFLLRDLSCIYNS